MPANIFNIKGLTHEQVVEARKKFGYNRLDNKKENGFVDTVKNLAKSQWLFYYCWHLQFISSAEMLEMVFFLQPPLY